jgi:protein-arginine kinase activator protein McsA
MDYTYEQLSKMTVTELRKVADGIENEALKGHLVMHKEQLLPTLCKVLGIEAHAHHHTVGIDKTAMKVQIRKLKVERAAATEKHDYAQLKSIRRQIHDLKRKIRRSIV